MPSLDWRVIRTSAVAGLMVVIPSAVLARLFVDNGSATTLSLLFTLLVIVGFAIAGFGAGRLRTDTPMVHGAAAAAATYLVLQAFGTVLRLIDGDPINWITYPLTALLAASIGILGALFAEKLNRTRARAA